MGIGNGDLGLRLGIGIELWDWCLGIGIEIRDGIEDLDWEFKLRI